ncbi:hypothetical protein Q4485_10880 [Granulosicoccaceae sp. 1_MG-2023]|nr:hypothetical protein [Granulosicoccaceae sp. 1_MG-2023]
MPFLLSARDGVWRNKAQQPTRGWSVLILIRPAFLLWWMAQNKLRRVHWLINAPGRGSGQRHFLIFVRILPRLVIYAGKLHISFTIDSALGFKLWLY